MSGRRIAALSAVPEDGSYLFRAVPVDRRTVREAILVRAGDAVAGWLNYPQHLTYVRLDTGGGAATRNGEIVCTNHGAMFEVDTGLCTHGPCEGAYLNGLDVEVDGGEVSLSDPDYAYVGPGPIPREPGDLSSTSNLEC